MPAALPVRADLAYFETAILPLVLRRGRRVFQRLACPGRFEDAMQDALMHAWVDFLRLVERDLAQSVPARSIAHFAVLRAKVGRRTLGTGKSGQAPDHDALSWKAQRRDGFHAFPASEAGEEAGEINHGGRAAVPATAAFRADFPRWAATFTERDQMAMRALAAGDGPLEVSRRLGHSPAWMTRRRHAWARSWARFTR